MSTDSNKFKPFSHCQWLKVKGPVYLLMESNLRAKGVTCHMGSHSVYLSPNTSEHTAPYPQPDRLALDLPTPEGWKAELT